MCARQVFYLWSYSPNPWGTYVVLLAASSPLKTKQTNPWVHFEVDFLLCLAPHTSDSALVYKNLSVRAEADSQQRPPVIFY